MNVTKELAAYSLNLKFKDLPPVVVEKAKDCLLDLIGVAIRAKWEAESSTPIAKAVKGLAKSGGNCTAIAHSELFPPQYAALINGAYAHSLDFDDTHRSSSIHPGAPVIPAVMALAEVWGATGKEFAVAMVVGYDVTCKLGKALNPSAHYDRGFHPTSTTGVFGATAAGACIAGLTIRELENAFGMNGSQAAGSMQYLENGAWNKKLHPGLAAHNAILSLALAKSGVIGAGKPIEGKDGFLHSYSGESDISKVTEGLGTEFEILKTAIKPYPCCRYTHGGIDLVLKLVKENSLEPENIEEIVIETVEEGVEIMGRPLKRKRNPKNMVDAQFSMPFNAAVAAIEGRVTVDDYRDKKLRDPVVRELMGKVVVKSSPELDRLYPERWASRVTVKAEGHEYSEESSFPKGEPENPLSWTELTAKFNSLTEARFSKRRRKEIISEIEHLEDISDMREVISLLRSEQDDRT